MRMTDVMLIEKCIEDCGSNAGTVEAWNRIKKDYEELAQQTNNSKSMLCRCGEPLGNHICPVKPMFFREACC